MSGLRLNLAALAFLALTLDRGAANAQDVKTDAVRADMNCVLNNVAKLDDGKMDPKHLAEMIVPLCHSLHEAAELALQPEGWKDTPADKARDMEFMHTWANVLWAREQLKAEAPNSLSRTGT